MEYRLTLADLPTSIRGFVLTDEDGTPRIVLNARLTREQNMITLEHEKKHIQNGELYEPTYNEYGGGSS